jgi:hypothetical protein
MHFQPGGHSLLEEHVSGGILRFGCKIPAFGSLEAGAVRVVLAGEQVRVRLDRGSAGIGL